MFNQPIAEAIYFLQYVLAQMLWFVNRMILSIAVITENINVWFTDNAGYFVELMTNALSAPLGGLFTLALTALGVWYLLNNIVPTGRWVDPAKLVSYGFLAFLFFSAPVWLIDQLEALRTAVNQGIDQTLLANATGEIFTNNLSGSDVGIGVIRDGIFPPGEPGVGSFDLAASFLLIANVNELANLEFPAEFAATYFPFGDPSTINLSDEADQQLAKALAAAGIERLFFAFFAGPTAVADHFLRLVLTSAAVLLYLGLPVAFFFAFFVYTQAFLLAYFKQFMNLLIETFMSVLIVTVMVGLLGVTAAAGLGLYLAASFIVLLVILWRIKSAFKLATNAFDLFGAAQITGGAGGMTMANMGLQAAAATGMAIVTGGTSLALTAGALGTAAALRYDQQQGGEVLGTDPNKTDARVAQLKAVTGYALGRSQAARRVIEGAHELRTMGRIFQAGEVGEQSPDALDYLRVGSSMSGFGSSPWLAMRLSPSLRQAYDHMGGRRSGGDHPAEGYAFEYEEEGEPVSTRPSPSQMRPPSGPRSGQPTARRRQGTRPYWRNESMTASQRELLAGFDAPYEENLTRGEAADLIRQRIREQQMQPRRMGRQGGNQPGLVSQADQTPPERGRSQPLAESASDQETTPERGRRQAPAAPSPEPASDQGSPPERGRSQDQAVNHPPASPNIYLESATPAHRQSMQRSLVSLAESATAAGRGTRSTLSLLIGQANTDLLAEAIQRHGLEPVQGAAEAITDRLLNYRDQGMSEAAILHQFQSGAALGDLETPLTAAQQSALADLVLMPRRILSRDELVQAMGGLESGRDTDLARQLGVPSGFTSYTGLVRELLTQVQAFQLNQSELTDILAQLQTGQHELARNELLARGLDEGEINPFLRNLGALPSRLLVPQTTRHLRPHQVTGEENQ